MLRSDSPKDVGPAAVDVELTPPSMAKPVPSPDVSKLSRYDSRKVDLGAEVSVLASGCPGEIFGFGCKSPGLSRVIPLLRVDRGMALSLTDGGGASELRDLHFLGIGSFNWSLGLRLVGFGEAIGANWLEAEAILPLPPSPVRYGCIPPSCRLGETPPLALDGAGAVRDGTAALPHANPPLLDDVELLVGGCHLPPSRRE